VMDAHDEIANTVGTKLLITHAAYPTHTRQTFVLLEVSKTRDFNIRSWFGPSGVSTAGL